MKPFSFRLQKVLEVKALLRKSQSEELLRLQGLRDAKDEERRYLTEAFLAACRRFAPDDTKPAQEFLHDACRLEATTQEIDRAVAELDLLENALQHARAKLLRLSQEKEMVETLKEQKLEQYHQDERRYEQKVLDEAALPRAPSGVIGTSRGPRLMNEAGSAKMLLLVAGGLLASFFAVFAGMYLGMVGPTNPLNALKKGTAVSADSTRADSTANQADSLRGAWAAKDTSGLLKLTAQPAAADTAKKEVTLPELQIQKPDTAGSPLREKQIRRVATIFSSLTPEAMDSIASNLDDDTLIEILKRSRERKAATLLGALNPERAARLTQKLAGGE